MLSRSLAIPPKLRRWGTYALILLAPGSWVVLPAWWLLRLVVRAARRESKGRLAACDPTGKGPPACLGHEGVLRRIWRRVTLDIASCKALVKN